MSTNAKQLRHAARISAPPIIIGWVIGIVTGLLVYNGNIIRALTFPPTVGAMFMLIMPSILFLASYNVHSQDSEDTSH